MREDIKSMTLEEMTGAMKALGEPAFRGKQVFSWLHKGVRSFDEMSNLSKALREKLHQAYYITVPTVERGFLEVVFWSIEIVGDNPSIISTSGFSICPKNILA